MSNIFGALLENIDSNNVELTEIAITAFSRAANCTEESFKIVAQREYIM